jgi:hypothetical protein
MLYFDIKTQNPISTYVKSVEWHTDGGQSKSDFHEGVDDIIKNHSGEIDSVFANGEELISVLTWIIQEKVPIASIVNNGRCFWYKDDAKYIFSNFFTD